MSNGLTLYEHETALVTLAEMLAAGVPPEQETAMLAEFQSVHLATLEKRDRVAQFMDHLESLAEAAGAEAKYYQERKQQIENAIDRMNGYVRQVMVATDTKKLEGKLRAFRACKGAPQAAIDDEKLIPESFWQPQPPKLKKTEIREALKRGEAVPGAHLTTPTEFDIIRRK